MLRSKALRLQIAGLAALAMLFASSAFAESRHFGGTRGGSSHSWSHSSSGRSGRSAPSRGSAPRSWGSRGAAPRVAPSWHGRSFGPSYGRSYGRSYGYGRTVPFHGYNSGSRFFGRGRITRVAPFHGGYHVWLGGWGYPFFVPYRYWDPFRFRIGFFVGFNAFYDPLGYYSVYDPWYYPYPPPYAYYPPPAVVYRDNGPSYDGSGGTGEYGSTIVRGSVQSADISRDTMWVNDEITHKVVAVLMPPDRALNNVRAGDYVEVSGEWKSDGVFDGHALDRYDPHH